MHKTKKALLLCFFLPELFFAVFLLCNTLFPLPSLKPYSRLILAEDGSILNAYLSGDDKWRMETKRTDLPPEFIKAILTKEDRYFYYHPGINLLAVSRAAFNNILHLKRTSGASTITMQLARMLEPANRTYSNKLLEMFRSLQLEWRYPKDKILSLYLSYLPYGGNIEGIKAASYIYFSRPPSRLSLAQAILLTVVPNRPNSLRMDSRLDEARQARDKWIRNFRHAHIFKPQDLDEALLEPVAAQRKNITAKAPHFSLYVKDNFPGNELRTSLNTAMQSKAEKLLWNHIGRTRPRGVSNGALIVIDNRTMEVKAYCGSSDFSDDKNNGQVNGVQAWRSPGSATKPLLYAFALDKGVITPKSILLDIPTNMNGYMPENFDLKYRGQVTADFALVQSLNIPAVRLLNTLGFHEYMDFLTNVIGFKKIKSRQKKLGLSVILGGCEVSLEELVHSYTAFANSGKLRPLKYLQSGQPQEGKNAFSPEAAYILLDMLSNNSRPDLPTYMLDYSTLPKIAWKTGTSYGKKDAWAIGVNPHYTIGVWMGNFNGQGCAELSGTEMAVPLLFALFDELDNKAGGDWFARPPGVLQRYACRESGMPAGGECNALVQEFYIKNISPAEPCNLYKEFYVDAAEKYHYCTACLPLAGYHKKKYPLYDPELLLYWSEHYITFASAPPHNPKCEQRAEGDGPKIISPNEGFDYFIDEAAPQEVALQAASGPGIGIHYWYIDNNFYKKGKAGEKIFFKPVAGKHKISCTDELGRMQSVEILFRDL